MKSPVVILIILAVAASIGCAHKASLQSSEAIIASGQMPAIAKNKSDKIHLVYGTGDSIMYSYSSDGGKTFSNNSLVAVLPELAASHTRGPQVSETTDGLLVTACTDGGNIYSYRMDHSGKWSSSIRVNDVDTVAKENLMSLSADGNNAFAVWLDLRDKHNKIFGAKSTDGGTTWSKNQLIYASPDSTVCDCCKPSVVVTGKEVSIMFRNWLSGNRDMHLIQSSDGGITFGSAQKLGTGNWPLKGCPMDGGSIVANEEGNLQTVWNRKGTIYACEPGKGEKEIGQGRSCTMETANGKNVYAWVEKGDVIVLNTQGVKTNLGKGQLPVLKGVGDERVLCVWENEKQIHSAIL